MANQSINKNLLKLDINTLDHWKATITSLSYQKVSCYSSLTFYMERGGEGRVENDYDASINMKKDIKSPIIRTDQNKTHFIFRPSSSHQN